MRKRNRKRSKGQAVVEYIIIIVIVAVAALTVLGIFSDRIRTIIAGVASTFGGDGEKGLEQESTEILKEIKAEGLELEGGLE